MRVYVHLVWPAFRNSNKRSRTVLGREESAGRVMPNSLALARLRAPAPLYTRWDSVISKVIPADNSRNQQGKQATALFLGQTAQPPKVVQ